MTFYIAQFFLQTEDGIKEELYQNISLTDFEEIYGKNTDKIINISLMLVAENE